MIDFDPRTNPSLRRKVYLAGRISRNDWRHEIVCPVGSGYEDALGNNEGDRPWSDMTIQGNGSTPLGWHEYNGPFFTNWEHGCGHAERSHGNARVGMVESGFKTVHATDPDVWVLPEHARARVFKECLASIDRSTHIFAWLEDLECFGTLWELGYAHAKGKAIYVAKKPGLNLTELWFAGNCANEIGADSAADAFVRFRRIVEASAALRTAVESPIEKLLLVSLRRFFTRIRFTGEPCWVFGALELRPQRVALGRYRLDFSIESQDHKWKLAIECDGHQFHERTKGQAQHDKSRDRDLAGDGWTVLRFTGSEVHKDADRCAEQILDAAAKLSQRESA